MSSEGGPVCVLDVVMVTIEIEFYHDWSYDGHHQHLQSQPHKAAAPGEGHGFDRLS